jgi:hypothetical protein
VERARDDRVAVAADNPLKRPLYERIVVDDEKAMPYTLDHLYPPAAEV